MSNKSIVVMVIVGIFLFLGLNSIYTVNEKQRALKFQFGRVVEADLQPGLHIKLPFVQNVKYFDSRVQTVELQEESYLTSEKKSLVVDSFVKWRVRNTLEYFVTVAGVPANANSRIIQRVNNSLRDEFGKRSVKSVVSGDRALIMDIVQRAVDDEAKEIGVEIVDVRLKRVDLDDQISESVYQRMSSERERSAKELRAQGSEEAERIRADADRQRQIILADAYRDSEVLRGEGDALATSIYASAFNKDREFYNLSRSLRAYKSTFSNKSDLLVLEPDSDFFKYFQSSTPATSPTP